MKLFRRKREPHQQVLAQYEVAGISINLTWEQQSRHWYDHVRLGEAWVTMSSECIDTAEALALGDLCVQLHEKGFRMVAP